MSNKSGAIGTRTETAVVRVLNRSGWPHAERRRLRGRLDPGDVTGTPGIAWSVKGGNQARTASDNQIAEWLDRTQEIRDNVNAAYGVLVVARKGIGYDNADRWWAIVRAIDLAQMGSAGMWLAQSSIPVRLHLSDICHLLTVAGYGTQKEASA